MKKHTHSLQAPIAPTRQLPAAAARPAIAATAVAAEPEAVARRRFARGSSFKVSTGSKGVGVSGVLEALQPA